MLDRAQIVTLVATALIAVKFVFGVEPPEELGGEITDWIMKGITIGSIFYNVYNTYRKAKQKPEVK